MAEIADAKVERFRDQVLPCLRATMRPERVIVFGSRAQGEALAHSDLDIIVVSQEFEGVSWLDRAALVIETCNILFGVELLCYTPEEFRRKREEFGIVRTAVEEGFDLDV